MKACAYTSNLVTHCMLSSVPIAVKGGLGVARRLGSSPQPWEVVSDSASVSLSVR